MISGFFFGKFPAHFLSFSTDEKEPNLSAVFYFLNDIIKITYMSIQDIANLYFFTITTLQMSVPAVVSIGVILTFKVIFTPLEYVPNIP